MSNLSTSREPELLLHCARLSIDTERAEHIRQLLAIGVDWQSLLALAQRNGLLPLLSHHLTKICPELLPDEKLEFLRDYFRKNSAFNLLLTGELIRVLKAFADEGIEALPYKGPAMAQAVYGELALRQFCDLDILVRAADVKTATRILTQQGFAPHFSIPDQKHHAFIRLGYVRLFRRDAGRSIVELHWRIAPRFLGVRFDTDGLWERLQTIELLGTQVSFPAPEDLLLMLCVHGAKDFWEKLEWVSCISELLAAHPKMDWDRIQQQACESQIKRMLLVGLILAKRLFDVRLPDEVMQRAYVCKTTARIADQVIKRFLTTAEPDDQRLTDRMAFHLGFKDRASEKVRYCIRLALTTTPLDWATMRLPASLGFLYLPMRAVRLTRRYGVLSAKVTK